MVDPKILHDPIHPAVEAGPGLELVEPGQGALAGALHEVVAVIRRARERIPEPSQTRQEADELSPNLHDQRQFPLPFRPTTMPPPTLFRQRRTKARSAA
jgi:hypothetical protein